MISLSVYNREGGQVGSLEVDESILGGRVRYALLKQAIVMYDANKRVGTAATKGRGMVAGSTRKLFRQKGTGNARVGNIRTGKRVGGGVTFAKVSRDLGKHMPKKQRRLATDSAVLAKLLNNSVVVVDELNLERPKTKDFAVILGNLQIQGKDSCLVVINDINTNLCKSAGNIPRIAVVPVEELNAGDVCNYSKMAFTKGAFLSFLQSRKDRMSRN